MCGRFTLIINSDEIKEIYCTDDGPLTWAPNYNISPSQKLPVLSNSQSKKWQMMKWGLNKTYQQQSRFIINIRKETLTDKATFLSLLRNKRCIIPASGFYEWKKEGFTTKKSVPFYFSFNNPICFAGLWDDGGSKETKTEEFAIITCPANQVVNRVHGRMPVVLDKRGQDLWLSDLKIEEAFNLLMPYSETSMTCTQVSQQVNNPSYNSMDCIKPFISGQQHFDY